MKDNQVMVESISDCTIVVDLPEYHLHREWPKRGSKFPFDREILEQAFYSQSVETLFREGYLKCIDKEFMKNVGLLKEDETPVVLEMTEQLLNRMIKLMPLQEFKETLAKMAPNQVRDLTDYAIEHYEDLKMDRVELLSKMTGKNVLRAIEYAKDNQED